MTTPPARPRLTPLGFGLVVGLLVLYAFCIPLAAGKDGDFSHLWVAGRSVVLLGPGGLYAPAAHYLVLTDTLGPLGPDLWATRNDLLGAFFYPPITGGFYTLLGLLPLRTAGMVHAGIYLVAAFGAAAALAGARWRTLGLPAALALVLLYPSAFFGFALGQNGVYALLVVAVAGWFWSRDEEARAGFVLGLLALKPSWWLAALVAPFALRSVPMMAGMVSTAAGLAVAGLAFGVPTSEAFLRLTAQLVRLDQVGDYPLHLQHNALGLLRRWGLPGEVGWGVAGGLGMAVFVRAEALPKASAWGLVWVTATLLNPHVHHYDLLVALVGVAALLAGPAPTWKKVGVGVAVYGAFLVEQALDTSAWVSLPALSLGLLWLALATTRSE